MGNVEVIKGNIWDYNKEGNYVVITCNQVIDRGKLVMGAGLALQAKIRYPDLPTKWKDFVEYGFYIDHDYKLIMLCTKKHFRDKSNLNQIIIYLKRILQVVNSYETLYDKVIQKHMKLIPIYIPKIGCGYGKLDWEKQVKPILLELLDERFILVEK